MTEYKELEQTVRGMHATINTVECPICKDHNLELVQVVFQQDVISMTMRCTKANYGVGWNIMLKASAPPQPEPV